MIYTCLIIYHKRCYNNLEHQYRRRARERVHARTVTEAHKSCIVEKESFLHLIIHRKVKRWKWNGKRNGQTKNICIWRIPVPVPVSTVLFQSTHKKRGFFPVLVESGERHEINQYQ